MQRLLPALVFAVFIHAMLLLADASWLIRHEPAAPSAQVVTMRLVERAPYCPPAMRSLPAPSPPLPKPQPKPAIRKKVAPKQAVKKKPVVPKPKPVVRKTSAKRLSTPPSPQPVPMLAAAEPKHESLKPPSVAAPLKSADDPPMSRSVLDSPAVAKEAATAPTTQTAAVATVVTATPRYSDNSPPAYPPIARKRGYEGTVIVEVLVREDGRVGDLRIAESSTYNLLDRSAVKAVKRWRFEPGRQAGKTVAMWVRVPVDFRLQ
jgi:protein TonB